MTDSNTLPAPRIAIKFGNSSSKKPASGLKKPSRSEPPSTLGKRPRPHALHGDSDSEADGDREEESGHREAITGFGRDGAEKSIPRLANRNWKTELKQKKGGHLPPEARAQQNGVTKETEVADEDKPIKWGLALQKKREKDIKEELRSGDEKADAKPRKPKTADEEAIDALLGKQRRPERTIQHPETDAPASDPHGVDAELGDYEDMPVEDFGAALLRGMGWDGKARRAPKAAERRPNQLGLGAKELDGKEDLGQWGQQKKRRPRVDEYNKEASRKKDERERRREGQRDGGGERERPRIEYADRNGDRHRDRDRDRDRDRNHRH